MAKVARRKLYLRPWFPRRELSSEEGASITVTKHDAWEPSLEN